MTVNKWFSGYNDSGQQKLYRDLIGEVVRLFGIDCVYIPRMSLSSPDLLFGDDPSKAFSGSYPVAVYIQNIDGFEGPGDLFTKFGLVINKQLRLLIGSNDFQLATSGVLGVRPREGDVIWMPNFQAFWEIKFTNADKFFYAFGSKPFYGFELVCEEFRYNNEIIDTGYLEIDKKVNEIAITYSAMMSNANSYGTFAIGERVTGGTSNTTAIVQSWNIKDLVLNLRHIAGTFEMGETLTGATSDATFSILSIELAQDINDPLDNNLLVRTEANTDLDTSESNPVQGDPILDIEDQEGQ